MSSKIKQRIVYQLKRSDKRYNISSDVYVGSTSKNLDKRLKYHISDAKKLNDKGEDNKLYRRMREVGVNNWEIVPSYDV